MSKLSPRRGRPVLAAFEVPAQPFSVKPATDEHQPGPTHASRPCVQEIAVGDPVHRLEDEAAVHARHGQDVAGTGKSTFASTFLNAYPSAEGRLGLRLLSP